MVLGLWPAPQYSATVRCTAEAFGCDLLSNPVVLHVPRAAGAR